MNYFDPVFSILGEIIVAGGGGALVTLLTLRAFGKGWLESYFNAKSITLKVEHDAAAARLKPEQDTALAELKRSATNSQRQSHRSPFCASKKITANTSCSSLPSFNAR